MKRENKIAKKLRKQTDVKNETKKLKIVVMNILMRRCCFDDCGVKTATPYHLYTWGQSYKTYHSVKLQKK